ncbi:MAG: DUF2167 domain-containing protein [Gammaproteobacteria bacterium]|nr:DUF2167 domain-containing protein [Gammaproteobacteria bacterium]MDH5735410.1 DUF2167 domain-containing protein [Gammaproteobacteria bacterium]
MKSMGWFVALLVLLSQPVLSEQQSLTAEQEQYIAAARKIWDSLDRQQGDVKLPNKIATLKIPENFYYLNPQHAETVLVDVWGNPPGAGSDTLGMILPSEQTPFDEGAWAVTIEYIEDGYVADENADEIQYDELLSQMKQETRIASQERVKQGYEAIELIGWAATPFYDKSSHKLHWAKEVKFGVNPDNTLNYNIRVLGRRGVLVLNFIAGMEQKQLIDANIDTVLALAEFDQGSRYEDFDASVDKVAAYGIGALVAGKVIAKTGFLAAALIFLKKFGILFLLAAGALLKKIWQRKTA